MIYRKRMHFNTRLKEEIYRNKLMNKKFQKLNILFYIILIFILVYIK